MKHTSIPLGDTLTKALALSSLTGIGSEPFHLKLTISEPESAQSPYSGTIEEWWSSEGQWRREITGPEGLKQIIVTNGGTKTEQDTGEYFPLWLRNFTTAAFDPVPDFVAWNSSGGNIEQAIFPNGARSDSCVRARSQIGTEDHAVDAFSNVCFDDQHRLSFYGSPRFNMELYDYRSFGRKQYARRFVDHPEPGTELVGVVQTLEPLAKITNPDPLFVSLDRNDDRFRTIAVSSTLMDKLTAGTTPIVWPSVHSGKTQGRLALYISADGTGRVREVWPLNSDNAGLDDPAREQVRTWQLKVAKDKSGALVQVDGGIGLAFNTQIGDALPVLSNDETRQLAKNAVLPVWLPNTVKPGDTFDVTVKVDERGKIIGLGFKNLAVEEQMPIHTALEQWVFTPLMRGGKPQTFYGNLRFAVPPTP